MIEKIQKESWFGFDVCVATPDMMARLAYRPYFGAQGPDAEP
jgi:ribosomal protein L1